MNIMSAPMPHHHQQSGGIPQFVGSPPTMVGSAPKNLVMPPHPHQHQHQFQQQYQHQHPHLQQQLNQQQLQHQHLQQHQQHLQQQQHQQQQQQQQQQLPQQPGMSNEMMRPVATASPPEFLQQNVQPPAPMSSPSSLPWTVGSTDGSFATMTLMQRQQHYQQNTSATSGGSSASAGATANNNASGGVAIGSKGEATNNLAALAAVQSGKSLYHDKLFNQSSSSVESVLAATCDVMGFDIAEMWLRTGPKTHQLTNSHLRPTALEDSVRDDLVDVYYGERSSERTHRLSPALCKRAKDANDVVWVTAHTPQGAEALRCSISNVRTAVAIPVCHEASNTNITIIFFSVRRIIMRPAAVEFLVHMSLGAAVSAVKTLAEDGLIDRPSVKQQVKEEEILVPKPIPTTNVNDMNASGGNLSVQSEGKLMEKKTKPIKRSTPSGKTDNSSKIMATTKASDFIAEDNQKGISKSEQGPSEQEKKRQPKKQESAPLQQQQQQKKEIVDAPTTPNRQPLEHIGYRSVTGASLDLQWRQLSNVEYLTDGGNSWIHTAVLNGKPVVVKTLKPECQDVALAINEIEGELAIHSRLDHPNIVGLLGAGLTSKGVRFVVLERLDGGTLTQMLGYDTRIRDRRRRFWRKKPLPYLDVLNCARAIASALNYCHQGAIPGSMILHRDLKPDNIGFTLDGMVKVIDFGLSRVVDDSNPNSNECYSMSGETGSLRYMAPEIADALPYNHKADVYSFGIILWEMNMGKKPFQGLNRDMFYERVIHGGERPTVNKKWPIELCKLITDCWDIDIDKRPTFQQVLTRLDALLLKEKKKGGGNGIGNNNTHGSHSHHNRSHHTQDSTGSAGGGKKGDGDKGDGNNNNNNKNAATPGISKKTLRRLSGMIDRHSTWF